MKKFIAFFILLNFISCQENSKSYSDRGEIPIVEKIEVANLEEVEEVEDTNYPAFRKDSKPKNQNSGIARKLIKNGTISFQSDSIKSTKRIVTDLVKSYKGYISSENTTKSPYRIQQYLTIRIPVDQFDSFLKDLSQGVNEFDRKQITVSDVTARFYDLTTRLKTKKTLEKRYLQILSKARNVKEILEVEKQLGKVREEIESMEGRLRLLTNQVSMSTFQISFYQKIERASEQPNKFVESFQDGIKAIKGFALFLISVWPFVILIFVSVFLIRRKIKRKSN